MRMFISTDNKKIKIFLPRNVSGLFKYSIYNSIVFIFAGVCLFVSQESCPEKKSPESKKGLGLLRFPDSITGAEEASVSE